MDTSEIVLADVIAKFHRKKITRSQQCIIFAIIKSLFLHCEWLIGTGSLQQLTLDLEVKRLSQRTQ